MCRFSIWNIQIIIQVMHMHLTIAETSSRCDVKVANHLVHTEAAFYAASLPSLLV